MSEEKKTSQLARELKVVSGELDKSAEQGVGTWREIRQMSEVGAFEEVELDELRIIYPNMHDKRMLNEFRELRTKLMQRAGSENFVVMVSSVTDAGGASYVSRNLAAAIALDYGKTAVLVDCNLSNPSVDRLLPLPAEAGLTDFLEDRSLQLDNIIYASGVPRMRVVPAGNMRSASSEYFSTDRMHQFVSAIKQRYNDRFVVIDGPPVGSSPDATILSEICDFALLVVPYGRVTMSQVNAGVDAINPDKLVGVVFNN